MTKLSDTQSVILSAAASRANRSLLPVPQSIRAKGKVLERSLGALLKRGFAKEHATRRADEVWRRGDDGRARLALLRRRRVSLQSELTYLRMGRVVSPPLMINNAPVASSRRC